MTDINNTPDTSDTNMSARDWVRVLAKYREPNAARSTFELAVSAIPFIGLWVAACYVAQYSYIGALAISVVNGLFLVRLFCIQHDCGHGSFYDNRKVSDWVGRVLGVVTCTPYDVWRRTHSIHHSHAGDLAHRGIGDVMTLTIEEYHQRTWFGRLLYRAYRHPIVMFGIGPTYLFLLQHRLPLSCMDQGRKYWISAMGTNAAMLTLLSIIVYFSSISLNRHNGTSPRIGSSTTPHCTDHRTTTCPRSCAGFLQTSVSTMCTTCIRLGVLQGSPRPQSGLTIAKSPPIQ